MVGLPTSTWITALLVFFAVALGTISVALVVELLQERKRQREALRQLRAFTNDEPDEKGILRLGSHEMPRWFRPIAARVPALQDIYVAFDHRLRRIPVLATARDEVAPRARSDAAGLFFSLGGTRRVPSFNTCSASFTWRSVM